MAPTGLPLRNADLARVQPFRWAWTHRLLLGYLNLLVGDEGVGKGTFVAWLVARLTTGTLPGDLQGKPIRVLMIGDEDGFDNVTVPRLQAAGADISMVADLPVGQHGPLDIRRDAAQFRELITREHFEAVFFDQFLDNLGLTVDDWRAKQVRHAIHPSKVLFADLDILGLATLHTNKSKTGTFRERVAGTQAFNALSRSSLLIAAHPDDAERRVVVRGKGNYSKAPAAVEFRIDDQELHINGHDLHVGVAASVRESDITIDDVLGNHAPQTKAEHGRAIIREALENGDWTPAAPILAELAEAGIADREARRLTTDLGVQKKRDEGFHAKALWRLARGGLPDSHSSRSSRSGQDTPATPATPANRQVRTGPYRPHCNCTVPADIRPDGKCARCMGAATEREVAA